MLFRCGLALFRLVQYAVSAATLLFGQGDIFANESHSEALLKRSRCDGIIRLPVKMARQIASLNLAFWFYATIFSYCS